jgi:HTH-type transcriptional regulator / antitoxin HipB
MSFPLRLPGQLKQHLRALRKSRGLTQAQLGALVGVKQARIAEIEANPGAVSLDQLTRVLAALGGTLHLHGADVAVAQEPNIAARAHVTRPKVPVARRKPTQAVKPVPRTSVVIRPKKGAW